MCMPIGDNVFNPQKHGLQKFRQISFQAGKEEDGIKRDFTLFIACSSLALSC